jgi:hypothetical protein
MQRTTPLRALAVAIALAAQSASAAVHVSPDGQGQVLLFPYYTVNAHNSTLLFLANHTDQVKAVKVRFREALNGRAVMDFNLYLPPFASWSAGVLSPFDDALPPRLVTNHSTCTVPAIPTGGVAFFNHFYNGPYNDDGPDTLDRTREGFIEVIEMGVVVDDGDVQGSRLPLPDAPGNRSGVDNQVENSGRHFALDASMGNGTPRDCESLRQAWIGGIWAGSPGLDMDEPSGGLSGAVTIVDVEEGVSYPQRGETLDGFFTIADSAALHTRPGDPLPTLASARTRAEGPVEATVDGQMLRWNPGTPNAVSSVLMHRQVFNDVHNMPSIDAASEWVLTFPTRHLHQTDVSTGVLARRPFADAGDDSPEDLSRPGNIHDSSVFDPDGSCERFDLTLRTQEGREVIHGPCIDCDPPPPPAPALQMCWQTNVLAWNQHAAVQAGATGIFGARRIAQNFELYDDVTGELLDRAQIELRLGDEHNFMIADPASPVGTVRDRLFGLPSIGFWAARYGNFNALPGVLANYAVLFPHVWGAERDRVIVTDEAAPGGITPIEEE